MPLYTLYWIMRVKMLIIVGSLLYIYIDFSFYSYSICLSMLGEGQQSKVRQSDPSKRFGIFREYLVMSVLH